MDDLISRQAAIDAVKELCEHYTPTKSVTHPHIDFVIEELQNLPSAEQKKGKWKEWWSGDCALIMTGEEMLWMCSECTAKFSGRSAYCPNCGAEMVNSNE